MGLVRLQVTHEVQGFQHFIHLALALLAAAGSAEESALLDFRYLLPVALLQQSITQHWHLHCTVPRLFLDAHLLAVVAMQRVECLGVCWSMLEYVKEYVGVCWSGELKCGRDPKQQDCK